jgi:O-antigen/teichoic acid export membrane protein
MPDRESTRAPKTGETGGAAAGETGAVAAGRGAVFIGAAKIVFMVMGFLQRTLLTRVVGAGDYGAFALVNNTISILNNTMVQGTVQGVSRFTATSDDPGHADAVKRAGLRLQLFFGGAVSLGLVLFAPWVARAINAPAYYLPWLRVGAVIPFLYGLYAVFVGSVNGQRRFAVQAGFDVTFSLCKTILLLGGAALFLRLGHSGVMGAFVGFAATAAIVLVIATRVVGVARGASVFPVRRLAVFFAGTMANAVLMNVALNYDILWLRRFAGAQAVAAQADAVAGHYEALRNVALLPYQALLVVTFVVFPLVSRSTFDEDRAATSAYVRQTMRLSLVLVVAMAMALGGRPAALLAVLYRPEYQVGAAALPTLVAAFAALALTGVGCAIINASGRPRVAVACVALAVGAGCVSAMLLVPGVPPGPDMLMAQARATAIGMLVGLAAVLANLWARWRASVPLATALRVGLAAAAGVLVGRIPPEGGKLAGVAGSVAMVLVFAATLGVLREVSAADRAAFARIVGRNRGN